MTIVLTSDSFHDGGKLDAKYTCDGAGVSPPLKWTGGTEGAQSYALIVHDPDAPVGDVTHWLLYDIPVTVSSLGEGAGSPGSGIGVTGKNQHGDAEFLPACPPEGDGMHRYMFEFYALKTASLGLAPGASRQEVERAAVENALDQAHIEATYQRG